MREPECWSFCFLTPLILTESQGHSSQLQNVLSKSLYNHYKFYRNQSETVQMQANIKVFLMKSRTFLSFDHQLNKLRLVTVHLISKSQQHLDQWDHCSAGCFSVIVWTHAVLGVLHACVLYFSICTCSAQLSMFHMERHSINTLIIITIINKFHLKWSITLWDNYNPHYYYDDDDNDDIDKYCFLTRERLISYNQWHNSEN